MSDADVRQRILDAALELFARQGYGSTSVREVVERAGVTKPALYYYFDNKEALFRQVVQGQLDGLAALVEQTVSASGPAAERLRTFVELYVVGAIHARDAARLMMTCSLPGTTGHPAVDVLRRHLTAVERLTEVVRQGQQAGELDPGVDAHDALIALIGAANLHVAAVLSGEDLAEGTVDRLFHTWLHGVAS